jgi:hypothetical protein
VLLKSGKSHFEAQDRALNVCAMNDDHCSPFPYVDCRWLRREFIDANLDDLIPHLDIWFADIAGIASRGKRLLRLTPEQLSAFRGVLALSFFDKHPEYAWIERHVSQSITPDLFDKFALYHQMRLELVALLDFMLREVLPTPSGGAADQIVGKERG